MEPGTFGPLNNVVTAAINEVGITTSGTAVGSITGPPGVRLLHVGWCGNFGGVDAFVREVDGGTWHVASSDLAAPLSAQWVDGTWLIRQNTQGIMQTVRLWVVEYENGDWVTTYEAQHSGLALDGVYHPPETEYFEQGGVHHLRLEYEREDGTQVRRVYQLQPGGYVLVEDNGLEEAH